MWPIASLDAKRSLEFLIKFDISGETMSKQPSITKIITIDYVAFIATLFPIVSWILYFALMLLKNTRTATIDLLIIFAALTVVAIGVLAWRIQLFNTIFNDGIETTATISNLFFYRDRGRVEYIYTFQGQKYASGNAVHKVRQTQGLQVGEQVILMVDRNNPKRAFIRELYV